MSDTPDELDDRPLVLELSHLTKTYHLRQERSNLRGLIPGKWGEITGTDMFSALDDVSFQVRKGESIGIVGRNGAGKSTILKVLAGIIGPTEGTVTVNGFVSAVIELGAAFEESLTGRENIYFSAGLMGLSREETDERFDAIADFSGIEEFLDMPVKRYSTGMRARLGFALATSIDPDVLIVDEVLSVGDFAFQRKSFERIREIHASGATLVLVSHNGWMVEQLCDRILLLERGRLVMDGPPATVMRRYFGSDGKAELDPTVQAPDFLDFKPVEDGPPTVVVDEMWTEPERIAPGSQLRVVARIRVLEPTEGVLVMSFYTSGRAVFAERDLAPLDFLHTPGTWLVSADIPRVPITTGHYMFRFAILPEDSLDPAQTYETAIAIGEAEFTLTGPVSARPGLLLESDWSAVLLDESTDEPEPDAGAAGLAAPDDGADRQSQESVP